MGGGGTGGTPRELCPFGRQMELYPHVEMFSGLEGPKVADEADFRMLTGERVPRGWPLGTSVSIFRLTRFVLLISLIP